MGLLKQGIPHTCDLFEDISRVSGLSPTHLGKRGGKSGFSHQNLTLAYRSVIGRGDSVAPTHKYCGKLEFRSYAL